MSKKPQANNDLHTLSRSDLTFALNAAEQIKKSLTAIQSYSNPLSPELRIIQPTYETSNNALLEEIDKLRAEIKNGYSGRVVTYSKKDGVLTCNIGNKTIDHTFVRCSKQKKLIDALTAKRSFVSTEDLLEITDSSNSQALSKLVGTVRDIVDNSFGFESKFFIINTRKSGYRINPKIEMRVIS